MLRVHPAVSEAVSCQVGVLYYINVSTLVRLLVDILH